MRAWQRERKANDPEYYESYLAYQRNYGRNRNRDERGPGVYLLWSEHLAAYKIGKASDVKKRLSSLRTSNPNLELVLFVPSDKASELEIWLHYELAEFHVEREWFRLPNVKAFTQAVGEYNLQMKDAA